MRHSKSDLILLIILILILVCGVIADFSVRLDFYFIVVEDLHDIIKTLFGVQSTVAILSFSILSILGSYLDKSYWGISIADFYSNKKNKIFKSKTVIVLEFVFILFSFFSLLLEFYNFIISVFVSTIILILWQTYRIYFIFKGDSAVHNDIEDYFYSEFQEKNNSNRKIELLNTYCDGWESIILEQSESEFQKSQLRYLEFLDFLLEEENSDCIKCICNNTRRLTYVLLISSKNIKKQQGILFLQAVYQVFWLLKKNESYPKTKFMQDFEIISNIIQELLDALKSVPKEWFTDKFNWYIFISYIDTVAIEFKTNAKIQELDACLRISQLMGFL